MKTGISVYHNILWSKYKGIVFSRLSESFDKDTIEIIFFQIAETDLNRSSLSGVDLSYHTYQYVLVFNGAYSLIPLYKLFFILFYSVLRSDSALILLPGYHKIEYWGMLMAAVLTGKKRAVFCDSTIYDQPQSRLKGYLKRVFFYLCDGFFSYGNRGRQYLQYYGAAAEKIFPRCQAAALPHNYSVESAFNERVRLSPNVSKPRFLYVGRFSPEKSLDILMRSFQSVIKEYPAASLVLVGAGPLKLDFEALALELGINSNVIFAGSMDPAGLAVEYARASCLVLPSFSEPWGLVVNEALSYGCPVVVSHRCGCVPELVENKSTGFVFEAGNIDELTEKLLAVPVAFSDVEAIARHCMNLISTFSPDAAANEILKGCKQILASR